MFCSKCGSQLKEGAKFCEKCWNLVMENNMNNSNNMSNMNGMNNSSNMSSMNSINNSNNISNMNGMNNSNNMSNADSMNNSNSVGNTDNFIQSNNETMVNINSNQPNLGTTTARSKFTINNKNKKLFIAIGGIVIVILIVLALIFVLGGNKKLVCTGQESGMSVTYEFGFKRKKIDNFKAKLVMEVTSSQMDAAVSTFESLTKEYKNQGMNVEFEKGDGKLTIILSGNLKEVGEVLGMNETDLSTTYDELKKQVQSTEGYTCK